MLALEWYRSCPLPDAPPSPPVAPPPGLTELSKRLAGAFSEGLFCDVQLQSSVGGASAVHAHRAVLARNPKLAELLGSTAAAAGAAAAGAAGAAAAATAPASIGIEAVLTVPGVSAEALREVVRAHYLEVERPSDAASAEAAAPSPEGPVAALAALRLKLPPEELTAVEAIFGPLAAAAAASASVVAPRGWAPLSRALLGGERFADCALRLAGGVEVAAHRFVVAGIEDGHFCSGALRWPGAGGGESPSAMAVDRSEGGDRASVMMPDGLSHEALLLILRLRYGSRDDVDVDRILEARHFADFLDWADAKQACEKRIEALINDATEADAGSLLAVVSHAEESRSMPARLKAAALAAAVRRWSTVAEAASAEESLPASRRAELGALSRIRAKDGHVCLSLEEYLHCAADDLLSWELSLSTSAPMAARQKLESAWKHWHELLFEYGHIFGAAQAEAWRVRISERRCRFREERAEKRTKELRLPEGKVWFEPSSEWREVPQNGICPGGLEYRCDMSTGKNYARLCA